MSCIVRPKFQRFGPKGIGDVKRQEGVQLDNFNASCKDGKKS